MLNSPKPAHEEGYPEVAKSFEEIAEVWNNSTKAAIVNFWPTL